MVFRLWLLRYQPVMVECGTVWKGHILAQFGSQFFQCLFLVLTDCLQLKVFFLESMELLDQEKNRPGSAGLTWETKMTNGITCVYVFTFFRALICMASVLSWATVSFSLSRSSCNVCLHCLSIFRSTSSCCLQEHQIIHWFARGTQISFCCSCARKMCFTHSCFSLFSICRCRLSALLAKSSLKRLVPSSAEVRRLSASCNLHHYNQGQTQDHR